MPEGVIEEQHGTPVLRAEFPTSDTRHRVLFLGDIHWDHIRCDRKALKRILDEAVAQDAWIVLLGDTLDLMQGRNDRRSSKSSIRPEHNNEDYFGSVLETAVDWFTPYAKNLWLVLDGNHETAILKHNEVNMTRAFVRELSSKAGHNIMYPGYSTYAMFRATMHKTRRTTRKFFLHHGMGGGGKVTKAAITAQRMAVTYPDADFVLTGHIHGSQFTAHEQWRINDSGKAYITEQEHYLVNTFKEEFKKGKGGWAVEKGFGPKVPSGWLVEFYLRGDELLHDWVRAK